MRRLIALPFGLLFVGLLLVTVTAISLRTFAFDPSFYTGVLKDHGVFQDFERDPTKYIDLTIQFSQLKALSADTQRQIITAALPAGWLEQSLKNLLRDFFDWLKSDNPPPPDLALDLRPIKDRLQGPPGKTIAQEVVAAIPTCAAGQQPNFSFDRLPECWPGNIDRTLIVDQVAQVLDNAAAGLSPSLDIGSQLVQNSAAGNLVKVRQWLQLSMVDTKLLILSGATVLVWLIGALIGGRYAKERFTWLGGWLMFGALITVAAYVLIFVGGSRAVLLSSAITLPEGLTSTTTQAVQDLVAAVIQQLTWRAIVPTALLLIVAAVLIGVGAAQRSRRI